eukprot:NODE_19_length_47148_cov_1.447810.p27 type:complete len:227 gc:universal NODE_19_length_47148_cov_1.447810:29776-30456(+)
MNQSLLRLNASSLITIKFSCGDDDYYSIASRSQYLSPYAYKAMNYFNKSKLGCFIKDSGISRFLPLSIVLDTYGLGNVISINLQATDKIEYCPETPEEFQDRILNGWKESCYLMTGSNSEILALSKAQKEDLFQSTYKYTFENWNWLKYTEDDTAPLKMFYLDNDTVRVIFKAYSMKTTIGIILEEYTFEKALICGIQIPESATLISVMPLICADGFLYLLGMKKI